MNNNNIINDWIIFCEGSSDFDRYHFHSLFLENPVVEDLKIIFSYFPKSDELTSLTQNYLFTDKLIGDRYLKNDLMDLALKDINQKKTLIKDERLMKLVDRLNVEFVSDIDLVISTRRNSPFIDFFNGVSDRFMNDWIIEDRKAHALLEAFYGLTNSYEMAWYLFQPLTNVKINLNYYYDLTDLGGVYTFYGNKILVAREVI